MKTIAKRADDLAKTVPDKKVQSLIRHAYINGAVDQRLKDTEKACNLYCKHCMYFGTSKCNNCELKAEIRKEMMKEHV